VKTDWKIDVRQAILTGGRNVTWIVGVAGAGSFRLAQMSVVAATNVLGSLGLMLLLLAPIGCTSVGPVMVPRDRVDYITAVAESWKEQTLLNVVRMRYGDAPTFVDVSSVVSAYAFQGQLSAGAAISSDLTSTIPRNLVTLGANATYVDRPTITYTPLGGDKFAKSLLRPIPPSAIFQLIQAGYPSDYILQMTARAINGVYNRSSSGGPVRDADPEFYPLLDALRRLQLSGAVSLRLEKRGAEEIGILILAGRRTPEVERDLQYVQKTLGVIPGKNGELTLTFGALPRSDKEIAVLSRSMLEILLEISAGIDVPGAHVSEGRTATAARLVDAQNPRDRPLVRILSGPTAPASSFDAVRYRGTWYWIDDDDFGSKRIFTFLMLFFSLAETGVTPQAPVLTIPVN
jgi:hypothetical protein